ncbi:hypothetical protein A0H81_00180 [Grifola frondosa]|uniref:Uncharacterized protein n=1 Tax=Grifola frondosa TaxID=5627 RepID=A0A1C7MTK8_GRIFR|nr:hypothetical protein A0H81_00180 [Grifola frondosa]
MNNFSLSPGTHVLGIDSPGSSVFDLPTQPERAHPGRSPPVLRAQAGTHTELSARDNTPGTSPTFLVISGGTGCNSICAAFGNACYVLPVSDDGGSSSEIIRVVGGPSIGDIRSRLVRLIPPSPPSSPRDEWRDIVEGRSTLWAGIPNDRKEMIRGFLVYFEYEILKRAHKNFSFVNGSIGNYFLSAAQAFFKSLPSAIFLFSSITNSQANILPVIVTNHTVTIAAELENGERLVGQCEISHPVPHISITGTAPSEPTSPVDDMDGMVSQGRNILFQPEAKGEYKPLDARISRLYYINAYGHEIHPSPNPDYLANLSLCDILVYSCGSLWTSIITCLALKGVASGIARSRSLRAKVLLLNSTNDRETDGYTAIDYIKTIARTLNAPYHPQPYGGLSEADTLYPISAFCHAPHLSEGHDGPSRRSCSHCVGCDVPSDERLRERAYRSARIRCLIYSSRYADYFEDGGMIQTLPSP